MAVIKIKEKKQAEKKIPKPDEVKLEKYKQELDFWQQKREEAEAKEDFSARNWAISQCIVKEGQIKDIEQRLRKTLFGRVNKVKLEEDYE